MADPDLHGLGYAVAYILFALGLCTTGLRFYSRAVLSKQWGLDDYSSIAVLVRTVLLESLVHLDSNRFVPSLPISASKLCSRCF